VEILLKRAFKNLAFCSYPPVFFLGISKPWAKPSKRFLVSFGKFLEEKIYTLTPIRILYTQEF